jgi:xylulokinase
VRILADSVRGEFDAMYLSIDLGSTHFKAGVFDDSLALRGTSRYALTYVPSAGIEVELSVDEVEKGLRYIIHKALSQANIKADSIKAIGIASQAQTFIILDEKGSPKTNFISWQDKRAVEASQNMSKSPDWSDFAEHSSFSSIYPGLQVCLLKHIRDHNPELIKKRDTILKLPSFVIRQLTDKSYLDNNLASMSGLFSLKHNDWWEKALDRCGLQRDQLPELCEIGTIACITTKRASAYGLKDSIPIILAGNDQTAGAYGAGIHESNALLITLGTAQVAYQRVSEMPEPSINITRGPYPYGMFYKMAVANAGGNVINWAKDAIPEIGSYENFFSLASESLSDYNGLKFYFIEDLNCGEWNLKKCKPSDYARSVLEYLCERMAELVSNMNVDLNNTSIVCAGGGSKQKIWVDILSEKLKTKIQPVDADPMLGSAMMSINSVVYN